MSITLDWHNIYAKMHGFLLPCKDAICCVYFYCALWRDCVHRRGDREPGESYRLCSCHFKDGLKENNPTIFKCWEAFSFTSPEKGMQFWIIQCCFIYGRNMLICCIFTALCYGPVSVSVTSRCSTKTAKRRITQTTLHDSPGTLYFPDAKESPRNSTGVTPMGAPNAGGVGQNRRLLPNNRLHLKNSTR